MIELVKDHSSPGFYSQLFLVDKSDGGFRSVIDLSILNTYFEAAKFKMETTSSIMTALSLRPAEWTMSIDLKDTYLHILLTKWSRKYLRFMIGNKVFQFRALPFGLSTAPLVFIRVMNVIATHAHIHKIRVHMYLDEWLLRALIRSELLRETQWFQDLCKSLGLIVNLLKSNLVPLEDFSS